MKIQLLSLFALTVLCVSGCRTLDPIMLDRAIVMNTTTAELIDVSITHQPTQITGSASLILPGKTFDLGFSQRPLRAEQAVVTWTQQGYRHSKNLFLHFEAPDQNSPYTLIYIIKEHGQVEAKLVSDASGVNQ